jgi:hypothetical protein
MSFMNPLSSMRWPSCVRYGRFANLIVDDQTKAAFSSAADTSKQLITLATGLLGLEITFAKFLLDIKAVSPKGIARHLMGAPTAFRGGRYLDFTCVDRVFELGQQTDFENNIWLQRKDPSGDASAVVSWRACANRSFRCRGVSAVDACPPLNRGELQ